MVILSSPRQDTPTSLGAAPTSALGALAERAPPARMRTGRVSGPAESVDGGSLPGVIHSAVRQDIQMSPTDRDKILARVASIKTRGDALAYLKEVEAKIEAGTDRGGVRPSSPPRK